MLLVCFLGDRCASRVACCLLFACGFFSCLVCCVLIVIRCGCYVLSVVRCALLVVGCFGVLFVVCWLVVRCSVLVVCCLCGVWFVACGLWCVLFIDVCSLFVIC